MNGYDFSGAAGAGSSTDLIPAGQLAFAICTYKGLKVSPNTGTRYFELELTIDEGQPFARRKIFTNIMDPTYGPNTDGAKEMGSIALGRMLEVAFGAGPQNPAGYMIPNTPDGAPDYSVFHGHRVAMKIKIKPAKDGYDAKNEIAEFLTPNPTSASFKTFQKLTQGVFNTTPASTTTAPGAAPAAGAPAGWGAGAQPAAGAVQAPAGWGAAPAPTPPQQPAQQAPAAGFQQPQQQPQAAGWGAPNGAAQTAVAQQTPAPASPSNPGTGPAPSGWLAQAQNAG